MNPTLKRISKWCLLTLLLAYAVVMVFWARSEAAKHTCKRIEISMEGRGISDSITVAGVRTELLKYPGKIIGAPLNTLNTLDIEKYLGRFNNFETVRCYLSTDGALNVNVTPMVPEIRVFDGQESYYVNKDGKRINSTAEFFIDVPVVTGHFSKKRPASGLLPVVRYVTKDSVLKNIVAMYSMTDGGDILLVPRFTGHVINIGDTTRLAAKRMAILTAYRNILPYKGWMHYDTISVKYRGQIVATRRDKGPLYSAAALEEEEDMEESTLQGIGDLETGTGE